MIKTCKNKVGLDCTYTTELASDLLAVYGLEAEKLFANMNGTTFNINKCTEEEYGHIFLSLELITNNESDRTLFFKIPEGLYR